MSFGCARFYGLSSGSCPATQGTYALLLQEDGTISVFFIPFRIVFLQEEDTNPVSPSSRRRYHFCFPSLQEEDTVLICLSSRRKYNFCFFFLREEDTIFICLS